MRNQQSSADQLRTFLAVYYRQVIRRLSRYARRYYRGIHGHDVWIEGGTNPRMPLDEIIDQAIVILMERASEFCADHAITLDTVCGYLSSVIRRQAANARRKMIRRREVHAQLAGTLLDRRLVGCAT